MSEKPKHSYLERAFNEGIVRLTGEGKAERIHYVATDYSDKWSDPEEKVRAEFWAELIYEYEYPVNRIVFEKIIPRRTPGDRADLIIYEDDEKKKAYFVFECKRADVSDAEFEQAIEQACGNRANEAAPYAGTIAGLRRRLLRFDIFPPGERERNHLTDIPVRYGKPPIWRFYKGGKEQLKDGKVVNRPDLYAVSRDQLRVAIRKCHQTLWEGGKRSPIAAFGEFCKIIFVKHRDEKNPDVRKGYPYQFQRRDGETADDLSRRIQRLYDEEKTREPDVFTEHINIAPSVLANCVEHLEGISLDRTELDTKGVAFEEFMGGFFKGDFGQYFTPRDLIAFAVEVLAPTHRETVIDPACGSGGFLLYALDHVRRAADEIYADYETDPQQSKEHFTYWHDFAEKKLFGLEVNDELARVAKMNMIIHDDGHTNIVGHDALDFMRNITGKNAGLAPEAFDVVLTNPPFGSVVKRSEKGEGYLEQFDLRRYLTKGTTQSEDDGSSEPTTERDAKRGPRALKERASIKTEILFLERIYTFLKPGIGRVAVVLPDGILTNGSLQGIRDWLLERFEITGVVSLPQFAFSHYDAGVKASLVFMRRLAERETVPNDQPIFMAIAENIGYDATGRPTYVISQEEPIVPGVSKIERHACDLFHYRVSYEWSTADPKRPGWSEKHREVIPDTGLVAQWRAFRRDATRFFV